MSTPRHCARCTVVRVIVRGFYTTRTAFAVRHIIVTTKIKTIILYARFTANEKLQPLLVEEGLTLDRRLRLRCESRDFRGGKITRVLAGVRTFRPSLSGTTITVKLATPRFRGIILTTRYNAVQTNLLTSTYFNNCCPLMMRAIIFF